MFFCKGFFFFNTIISKIVITICRPRYCSFIHSLVLKTVNYCIILDNDDVNKMALPMLDGLTCKLLECATLAMNNRFYEKSQVPSEIQEALVDV